MLKIKDNVDLKELKKYGLQPFYNINDGSIDGFIQKYGYPYVDEKKRPFIKFNRRLKKNNIWKTYNYSILSS